MSTASKIGDAMRAAMGKMTMAELARRTDLNRQQLHRYVTGAAVPRADAYLKIAAALQLDPWIAMDEPPAHANDRLASAEEALKAVLGRAQHPTIEEMPSGVYDSFSSHPKIPNKIFHMVVAVQNEGDGCRFQFRVPYSFVPRGTPYPFRQFTGQLFSKFGSSLVGLVHNEIPNGTEDQSILYVFGPADFHTKSRLGVSLRFDPASAFYPIATKVIYRPAKDQDIRRAFRECKIIDLQSAPGFIRSYFGEYSYWPGTFGPMEAKKDLAEDADD